jgi:DNA-binding XRE family transcriptional regulator
MDMEKDLRKQLRSLYGINAHMTLQKMAAAIGVSRICLHNFLYGKCKTHLKTLCKIERYLEKNDCLKE